MFENTRDRFVVEIAAFNLERSVGRDLRCGEQLGLDEFHERGVAHARDLRCLREIKNVQIAFARHWPDDAMFAAYRRHACR